MCFRPSDTSLSVTCSKCGKAVNATMGIIPKVCPFCKNPIDADAAGKIPANSQGPAPSDSPSAPVAPAVPPAP